MNQANPSVILIIPSASYRTSPFMDAVSKLELKVLVLTDKSQVFSEDYPDNVITMNFEHWRVHIENIREWSVKHDLKAVLGVDEESIILAARLSEVLGLVHNSLESVKLTKDKFLMRNALKDAGIKSPWFKRFSVHQAPQELVNEISFPSILKPTFLSASQGVVLANSIEEFKRAFEMLSKLLARAEVKKRGGEQANWILVEEFLPGKEVSLEGIVSNGKLKELAIFDKPETLDGPTFPETILITPTLLDKDLQGSLFETAQTALEALGIIKGPVHIEFRINKNGIFILECAARSIGGLCTKVLEFKGGMSLEELILRSALGRNIEKTNFSGTVKGVMMMPINNKGILREIRGTEAALAVKGITELQITIKRGGILEPLPEGGRYLGFIFAEGKDQDSVLKNLKKAWAKIEIVSDNI
jgi:biotin carboxylase